MNEYVTCDNMATHETITEYATHKPSFTVLKRHLLNDTFVYNVTFNSMLAPSGLFRLVGVTASLARSVG